MVTRRDIENAYALIIGISKYKDPRLPELRYTRADAEGMFRLLTDKKKVGLNPDNIKILLDNDATSFNIKNSISNWLFRNADQDSIVFIYFAGHGGVEVDRLGIEKDKLAKFLLPDLKGDQILEPYAVKVARSVLRRRRAGNRSFLFAFELVVNFFHPEHRAY